MLNNAIIETALIQTPLRDDLSDNIISRAFNDSAELLALCTEGVRIGGFGDVFAAYPSFFMHQPMEDQGLIALYNISKLSGAGQALSDLEDARRDNETIASHLIQNALALALHFTRPMWTMCSDTIYRDAQLTSFRMKTSMLRLISSKHFRHANVNLPKCFSL
jgi:hypothetical protein